MPASCASNGFCGKSRIFTGDDCGAGEHSVRFRGPPKSMMCAPATRLFNRAWALRFGKRCARPFDRFDGPARDVPRVGRGRASRDPQPLADFGRAASSS